MSSGGLTKEYLNSYGGSAAIQEEHRLDADYVLRAMRSLPGFWEWLGSLSVIESLDVGSGEGLKSQYILEDLLTAHQPRRAILHMTDWDDRQLQEARSRIANHPVPNLELRTHPIDVNRLLKTWAELGLDPAYVTMFHVAYYLEQEDDKIPAIASIARRHAGYTFFLTEGHGQLQDLKWYMNANCGYGTPASSDMIVRSLSSQGLRVPKPIKIPHRWTVDLDELPAVMFERDFEFLLANNFDCPAVTGDHRRIAGEWIQRNAHRNEDGSAFLEGPDDLIVTKSSRRLQRH